MMYVFGQLPGLVIFIVMCCQLFLVQGFPQPDREVGKKVITKRSYANKHLHSERHTAGRPYSVTTSLGTKRLPDLVSTKQPPSLSPVATFGNNSTRTHTDVKLTSGLTTSKQQNKTTSLFSTFSTKQQLLTKHDATSVPTTAKHTTEPSTKKTYSRDSQTKTHYKTESPTTRKYKMISQNVTKQTTITTAATKVTTVLPTAAKETTAKLTTTIPITTKETKITSTSENEMTILSTANKETKHSPKSIIPTSAPYKTIVTTPTITTKQTIAFATTVPPTTNEKKVAGTAMKHNKHSPIITERTFEMLSSFAPSKLPATISLKTTTLSDDPSAPYITRRWHHSSGHDLPETQAHAENGPFTNTHIKVSLLPPLNETKPNISTHEGSPLPQTKEGSDFGTKGSRSGFQQMYTTPNPSQRVTTPEMSDKQITDGLRSDQGFEYQVTETTGRIDLTTADSKGGSEEGEMLRTVSPVKPLTVYPPWSTTSKETDSSLGYLGIVSADLFPVQGIADFEVTSPPLPPGLEHEEDSDSYKRYDMSEERYDMSDKRYDMSDKSLITQNFDNQGISQNINDLENWATQQPDIELSSTGTQIPEYENENTDKFENRNAEENEMENRNFKTHDFNNLDSILVQQEKFDTFKPELEILESKNPENGNTRKPDLENLNSKKFELENIDTFERELNNVDTLNPEIESLENFKPERENLITQRPKLEILTTQKSDVNKTMAGTEQKDGEKETFQQFSPSQLSDSTPSGLQFETDKTSAVSSTTFSFNTTIVDAVSLDPMVDAGNSKKTTEIATVAMTTQSNRKATFNIPWTGTMSPPSSTAQDTPEIKGTQNTNRNEITEAYSNINLFITEAPSIKSEATQTETFLQSSTPPQTEQLTQSSTTAHAEKLTKSSTTTQTEKLLQNSTTIKMESSSQTSEEIIRTTTRKLLEQTPVETSTEMKTPLTSSSLAQTGMLNSDTTDGAGGAAVSAHSKQTSSMLTDQSIIPNSTPVNPPLLSKPTRPPSASTSQTPDITTSHYASSYPTTIERFSLTSTLGPIKPRQSTNPSTAKTTEVSKSYKTAALTSALPTPDVKLPLTHTSVNITNTPSFQESKLDTTNTSTTTTPPELSSQLTTISASTRSIIRTQLTSATTTTTQTSSATTPKSVPFASSSPLTPSTISTHMTSLPAPTLLTTTPETLTTSLKSSSPSTKSLKTSTTTMTIPKSSTSPTTTPKRSPTTITTTVTTSTTTKPPTLRLGSPCTSNDACGQYVYGSICREGRCMCDEHRYPVKSETCVAYDAKNFTSTSLTNQSNSSFTIQLPNTSPPPNVSLVYSICWNGTEVVCRNSSSDSYYVISGLTPGTVYYVTVDVIIGQDDPKRQVRLVLTSLTAMTDPPDVGEIQKQTPSPPGDQMNLTFGRPKGNFDFCRAELFELDITGNVSSRDQSSPRTQDFNCIELDLKNLSPGIEYKLIVQAVVNSVSGQKNSSKSNYRISTPGRAPDAVQNVRSENITSLSALVTWSRPTSVNGYLTGYDVSVCADQLSEKDIVQEKKIPCDVPCLNVTQWKEERLAVEKLCVATNYVARVTASNMYKDQTDGTVTLTVGPTRNLTFTTSSTVPKAPSNVTAVALNSTTVSLSWAAPESYPGPTSYVIVFRTSNTTLTTSVQGYSNTNVQVRGLTPFTSYTWTISANTSAGASGTITGSVITKEAGSDKVVKLKVTGSTPNAIAVSWARPYNVHGHLGGYVILVRVSADTSVCQRVIVLQRDATVRTTEVHPAICKGAVSTSIVNTTNTAYTVIGLAPCETYTIEVAAYNGFGIGEWTIVTSTTSVPAPTTQWVNCSGYTKGAVSLTWDFHMASNCLVNYSVTVYRSDRFIGGQDYTRINQTFTRSQILTISGLKSFWVYKFNVTASTTAGSAHGVAVCRTLSDAPGRVQNLRVHQVPGRPELQVTWECPDDDNKNGMLKSFYLVRKSQSGHIYQQSLLVSKNLPCYGSVPVEGICNKIFSMVVPAVPEMNYTVSVQVKNCQDVSGPNEIVSYYNPALVPPPMPWFPRPSDNVEKTLNSTSFTVTICPSRLLNNSMGAIVSFGIIICRSEFCDIDTDRKWPYFVKDSATWAKSKQEHFEIPYRVTNSSWEEDMRKQSGMQEEVAFEVGIDTSCQKLSKTTYCNGPLPFGKFFRARVFACTLAGCVVSNTTHDYVTAASKSDSSDNIVIGGALAGIAVAIVVLVTVVVIKLRMRPKKPPRKKISNRMSQAIAMEEIVAPKDDGKSKPIKIKDFDATLLKLHADGNALLNQEYQELDKLSPLYPTDVGSDLDHRADNRWTNIIPFDHSRVKLSIPEGESGGHDYINANFIAGLDSKHDYIATQGPLTRTVPDFWRMIWEQQVAIIVMLSDFAEMDKRTSIMREKVAKYFPDEEESNSIQYGQIMVARTGKLDTKDWEIRTLKLTHVTEKKNRFVKHFFFKYWSDHEADINPADLIEFVRVVQAETNTQPRAPLVVHCSAGVGRTGTFIAVDYFNRLISGMKQKMDKTKSSVRENWTVDIFGRVLSMRDKRRFMVQSRSQYIFIYDVVQELLRQAFKSEKVKGQEKVESYEDGPSTSSGSLKEDAVYDDVELLKGQMTGKDHVTIREKDSGSSTDASSPKL